MASAPPQSKKEDDSAFREHLCLLLPRSPSSGPTFPPCTRPPPSPACPPPSPPSSNGSPSKAASSGCTACRRSTTSYTATPPHTPTPTPPTPSAPVSLLLAVHARASPRHARDGALVDAPSPPPRPDLPPPDSVVTRRRPPPSRTLRWRVRRRSPGGYSKLDAVRSKQSQSLQVTEDGLLLPPFERAPIPASDARCFRSRPSLGSTRRC